LTDWVRSVADRLAEEGYIAIAPDLLSGMGPDGGKTSDFPNTNAARDALYELDPDQIHNDLDAVAQYVTNLDACDGTLSVAGFCWGGRNTFLYATQNPDIEAAFVFYGTAPDDPEALANIECPVYGFYGGDDNRVTSTVDKTIDVTQDADVHYEATIYGGAGHGFMRTGETAEPTHINRFSMNQAWDRWLSILNKIE